MIKCIIIFTLFEIVFNLISMAVFMPMLFVSSMLITFGSDSGFGLIIVCVLYLIIQAYAIKYFYGNLGDFLKNDLSDYKKARRFSIIAFMIMLALGLGFSLEISVGFVGGSTYMLGSFLGNMLISSLSNLTFDERFYPIPFIIIEKIYKIACLWCVLSKKISEKELLTEIDDFKE